MKNAPRMATYVRYAGTASMALLLLLLLHPAVAQASNGPASTSTVSAGKYIIDVSLTQNPPYVDTPFTVIIQPRDHNLKLSGNIIVEPGLGTNGINITTPLQTTNKDGALSASIHMPVRGAWNITIHLNGPQGPGIATVPVVVGAPGAMPIWLAWTIGSIPLVFIAAALWFQHRYRKKIEGKSTAA